MKSSTRLRKSSKLCRSFLLSYFIFVGFILCTGFLSIYISTNVIEDQVDEIYNASLEQMRTVTDGYLSTATQAASELMFNSRVQSIHMSGDCVLPQDIIRLTELQGDMRSTMILNPTIKKIAIYFPNGDFIIDNMACYRADMLDNWSRENYYCGFSRLDELYLTNYTVGSIETFIDPISGSVVYNYFKSLGDYPSATRQPVLLVTMNSAFLSSLLSDYEQTLGAPVFLVMEGGIIHDSSFHLTDGRLQDAGFLSSDNSGVTNIGFDRYCIVKIKSAVMSAKYVGIVPSSLYFKRVNDVVKIMLTLISGITLICVVLAVYFSKRGSAPIEKIARLLRTSGKAATDNEGMYDYIDQTLSELLSDYKQMQKNLDVQKQEIKESFLVKFVSGNAAASSLEKKLEQYNIELTGDLFISTAYIVEDPGPNFAKSSENSMDLLKFAVRNTVEELTMNEFDCFMCSIDNAVVCISSSCSQASGFYNSSISIARTVVDFFDKKLSVKLIAAVSNPQPGILSVPRAYQEDLEAFEYRAATGSGESVCIAAEKEASVDAFGQSLNIERLFINCIRSGDFNRAKQMLIEIIGQCKKMNSLSLIKIKMAGLVSSVLSALMEYGNDKEADYQIDIDTAEDLIEAKSIEVLERKILGMLDRISASTKEKSEKAVRTLINRAESYLKENYSDPLLNVSSLADRFEINRSYLSQKFKAQTGKSPIEYLNRVRIEKAKEMIRSGARNYSEVAAACGYYDSHALNVAFKKYEGVAPSRYRKLIEAEISHELPSRI